MTAANTVKAMFYRKNLYTWERVTRVAIGAGVAAVPMYFAWGPSALWVISGIGFALTGFVGFCPMCALVGRRIS